MSGLGLLRALMQQAEVRVGRPARVISGNVKGTNMLTAVKALRASAERARTLLPPLLHRYLEERILVSSWYPETDLMQLLGALGAMMPPGSNPFEFMGRHTAHEHLSGIYRGCVKPGALERTLTSATALWRNYHDSGEMLATAESARSWVLRLEGFAASTREFCMLLGGYFRELAELSGVKTAEVTKLACCLDGAPDCRWRLAWH